MNACAYLLCVVCVVVCALSWWCVHVDPIVQTITRVAYGRDQIKIEKKGEDMSAFATSVVIIQCVCRDTCSLFCSYWMFGWLDDKALATPNCLARYLQPRAFRVMLVAKAFSERKAAWE
jgi:hypothetical protein